jgi:cytochrome c-type biogenesis protein CcmH/NrfF
MKRALKWLIPLLVVLLLGGFIARTLSARKTERETQARDAALPTALELAASDVVACSTSPVA